MKRRDFIQLCTLGALGVVGSVSLPWRGKAYAMSWFKKKEEGAETKTEGTSEFPFQLSDKEWRKHLTKQEYNVLRDHGTERANTSPLDKEKRNGSFLCKGCDHRLFLSEHKFDSGTGWPSFWNYAEEGSVGTSSDFNLFYPRTEVHCANCGGHLGHIFKDGPKPTGLRYCINGVALSFKPTES